MIPYYRLDAGDWSFRLEIRPWHAGQLVGCVYHAEDSTPNRPVLSTIIIPADTDEAEQALVDHFVRKTLGLSAIQVYAASSRLSGPYYDWDATEWHADAEPA